MGFRRSGAVPVCSLLLALALSLPFSTPALGQDVASGVAELRRLFEDELLFDRLTPDSAVAAVPTAQYVAANATDPEGRALGRRALAEIAMKTRDFASAEAGFRQVLSLHPRSTQAIWARFGLGVLCVELAQFQGRPELRRTALREFQAALDASPAHPIASRALEKIGLGHLDLGDYERAVQVYNRVIATYPGTPGAVFAHGGLARAYAALRRWDDGIRYARLRVSFARYPRAWDFQLLLGIMLREKGDLAGAVAELDKLLAVPAWKARHAEALREKVRCLSALADSYIARGRYAQAIEMCRKELGSDPYRQELLPLLLQVGRCQHRLGQYPEAIATFFAVAEHDLVGGLNPACRKGIAEAREALRRKQQPS